MIAVVADDITGAAEIAGIGYRFGLTVGFLTEVEGPLPECDVLVLATDTRSMNEQEAVTETHRVVRELRGRGVQAFFKKTDSALRGHIVAELKAFLQESGCSRALLMPQNPSKGRIVKQGVYYINGRPLQETSFAFDPEFPANSSVVAEHLMGVRYLSESPMMVDTPAMGFASGTSKGLNSSANGFASKSSFGGNTSVNGNVAPDSNASLPIYVADADSEMQMAIQLMRHAKPGVLLAGAADLFTAYLHLIFMGNDSRLSTPEARGFSGLSSGRALIVCGSTQSTSLSLLPYVERYTIPTEQMPEDVFEGTASPAEWESVVKQVYSQHHALILTIGRPSKGGKEFALRLRAEMADATTRLVHVAAPDELIIEGGATAFAILKQLGWTRFEVSDEVSPGVVRMKWLGEQRSVHVILKPGSYSWGGLFV